MSLPEINQAADGAAATTSPAKARDYLDRFREVVSDPLNLLIDRVPMAGTVEDDLVCLHNGNRTPFSGPESYFGDFSQILVINRGVHEPLEEFVFQELLRRLPEAPVMLELGAYWGHYSMWLKRERPQARVVMVEPKPRFLRTGRKNFERNGYEGEFIHGFVGHGQFEVDQFLDEQGLDHLDVLHCDIQGFELEMLQNSAVHLERKAIDYLFISTHSQKLHHRVVKQLRAFGYRIEVSCDFDAETTSFDGLVFASSPHKPALFEDFVPLGREQICAASAEARVAYVAQVFRLMAAKAR